MCVYGALGGRTEFITISMTCNHHLKNKVSFELKSAFRDVARYPAAGPLNPVSQSSGPIAVIIIQAARRRAKPPPMA